MVEYGGMTTRTLKIFTILISFVYDNNGNNVRYP